MVRQVRIVGICRVRGLAVALLVVLAADRLDLAYPRLLVGRTYAVVLALGVGRARRDDGTVALGPADLVTLIRAVLVAGVAALVGRLAGTPGLGARAGGAVRRRPRRWTRSTARRSPHRDSASSFGARFDMEIDAFLIAGAERVGRKGLRRLGARDRRGPLRPLDRRAALAVARSRRCRIGTGARWSAAIQGVVLTVVVSGLLPRSVNLALLVGAVGLAGGVVRPGSGLAVATPGHRSRRHLRRTAPPDAPAPDAEARVPSAEPELPVAAPRARSRTRRVLGATSTVLAFCLVWVALTAPDAPDKVPPRCCASRSRVSSWSRSH